jgi:hypothetical protein
MLRAPPEEKFSKMLFEELGLFENFEELGPVATVENIPASPTNLHSLLPFARLFGFRVIDGLSYSPED